VDEYRPLVMVSVLSAIAGALFQKYVLTRKVSTGEPPPPIIAKPAEALTHAVEKAAGVVAHVAHRHHHDKPAEPPAGPPKEETAAKPAEPTPNGPAEHAAAEPPKVIPPG
jgi:hypothetical protein